MDRIAASDKFRELSDLFQHATYAIFNEKKYQDMEAKQSAALKKLQEKHEPMKHELWQTKKLLSAYQAEYSNALVLCPECNGYGGHEYETMCGMEGEPCSFCDTSGIVNKLNAEEWEAKRTTAQTTRPTEVIEFDPNNLPF